MSAGTSEFFCVICLLVCSCRAQTNIPAEVGQDVILPCKAPNINDKNDIIAVKWIRPGLDPKYVLFYRDEQLDEENQNPSYQNRVDLKDKDMKDGDVSLILKNVTKNDTGTYECWVQKGKNESISLVVHLSDNSSKNSTIVGLAVGLAVSLAAVFILLIVAVVLYVHTRGQERKSKTWGNEELKLMNGDQSETDNQPQQEKTENEMAKSEIKIQKNHLQEYKDENLKWMETERKLKNQIHNQIQELDEMNFDSNFDSTESNKKNQQKELEKLQLEKQNWMKIVGNLKTELQNMNKKLELTGSITVEEVHIYGNYIHLKNISSEEINLEGWKLKLQINNNKPAEYRFNESVKLPAERILTMGYISRLKHPEDVKLDWSDMKWNPEDKLRLKLISNNGETFKLL